MIKEQLHLTLVRSVPGAHASSLFDLVRKESLEGIVIKAQDSSYQVGKWSHNWLKVVINYHYHNVRLTGLRKDEFGWLIGIEENGRIRPTGIIEYPPPESARRAVWNLVELATNITRLY